MVYYDRVQADWPLQVNLQVGSHTPSWCTASGKLYLSSLPKDRCQSIINKLVLTQYTRNTLVDASKLESQLQHIKTSGVGTDNEEFIDGMVAIAVPITDSSGKLCACLFTHAPVIRKSFDELSRYTDVLQCAAAYLGHMIDDPEQ
jgi:DNA-binding IclR family transcriptional regulator